MSSRGQFLRSSVSGSRPAASTREIGEFYLNFSDRQIGYIDPAKAPIDLLAVRFFSTSAAYATGDITVQGGALYRAKGAVSAGAFNAANWDAYALQSAVDASLALKLDASAYTAADVLTKVKTVDGTGSGLDADLLDGLDSAAFASAAGLALKADINSPTFTGDPKAPTVANTDSDTSIATTAFVKSVRLDQMAQPNGSIGMNGQLITNLGAPANPNDAVTKAYVDAKPAGAVISDTPPASPTQGQTWWESDTGAFHISYNDGNSTQWVQINSAGISDAPNDGSLYGRLNAAWAKGAPLNSPALTGTPSAPTAAVGTNTTQLATTAFCQKPMTRQVMASGSGTWNRPAGCRFIDVEVWGGGGGGGGVASTAASAGAAGGGGGAGGYSRKFYDVTGSPTFAWTVGGAGSGGSAGATGGAGGQSNFGPSVVAAGGSGGNGSASIAANWANTYGGAGGAGGGGDVNGTGSYGGNGTGSPQNFSASLGGAGANSAIGGGALPLYGSSAGGSAVGYASGGGGACNGSSQGAAKAGGPGQGGLIIVTEYY